MRAFAKINLFLNILGKREDQYHQVSTLLQSISLTDEITLAPSHTIELSCDNPALQDGENLVLKAARLLKERHRVQGGASIALAKSIPIGAGLGGGSSDAAATLVGLNKLWRLGLPFDELAAIGSDLGADVPFCLSGGTAFACGKGDLIEPLMPMPKTRILLFVPSFRISTAWAYRSLDENGRDSAAQTEQLNLIRRGVEAGDWDVIANNLSNTFEPLVFKHHPELLATKSVMGASARGVGLTGSGPTLFGIVAPETSLKGTDLAKVAGPNGHTVLATTSTTGWEIN